MTYARNRSLRLLALSMAAALFLTSCFSRPLAGAPPVVSSVSGDVGTIQLNVGDLLGRNRSSQWVRDSLQARLKIDGPDMGSPLTLEANVASSATASVTITQVPVGAQRIISLERLDALGSVLPGGSLKTTVDVVQNATAIAPLNASTTPRGSVFERLLAYDRAHATQFAKNTSSSQVQALIDQLLQQAALFPALIDTASISADVIAANQVPAYSATFALAPAALDVTLAGIPGNAPADVWLDDPLSPKNVTLNNGTHRISSIVPGTWTLHAYSASMSIESTASLVLISNQVATVSLNLGDPPEQLQAPLTDGIKAAATIATTLAGRDVMLMLGGCKRATDSLFSTNAAGYFDGTSFTPLPALTLPDPLAFGQGVASGSTYYVAGGVQNLSFPILTQDVYQHAGSWTKLTLPEARGECSLAVLGNSLYVIGGFQNPPGGTYFDYSNPTGWNADKVFKYDGASWTTLAGTVSFGRGDMAAATVNNRIYVFGGARYEQYGVFSLNWVESTDAAGDTWRRENDMPTARSGAAAVVVNGLVYVLGGCATDGIPSAAVEVFNPMTGTWRIRPPLRKARGYLSAAYLNGQIVVVGGGNGGPAGSDGLPQATVEAFAP